jgi:transcriptional regulator GlxA family with amidase domain
MPHMKLALFAAALLATVSLSAPEKKLAPPANHCIPVAFVLTDGATMIDFAGPWEVFQDVMFDKDGQHVMPFQLYTVSDTREPVRASGGMMNGAARVGLLTPLDVESGVLELLGDAAQARDIVEPATPAWLPRVLESLRENARVRVADLAREADVHPVHFTRTFRRRVGTTPVRICSACVCSRGCGDSRRARR